MNKTRIEWTDYTWNPVTGCWGPGGTAEKPNRCAYCYAVGVANRFYEQSAVLCGGTKTRGDKFAPRFHPERLSQPAKVKKPSKIFVCSMADLFGDWVPFRWIEEVLRVAQDCEQHTFQFLTKNPKRLTEIRNWPKNCWVGTTVTNQADADERLPWLLQVDAPVRFVSHEPLLENIDATEAIHCSHCGYTRKDQIIQMDHHLCNGPGWINWAIIGAMTGPGAVRPKTGWVQGLVDQYRAAAVPLFLKDNLKWPEKIQEWPT